MISISDKSSSCFLISKVEVLSQTDFQKKKNFVLKKRNYLKKKKNLHGLGILAEEMAFFCARIPKYCSKTSFQA